MNTGPQYPAVPPQPPFVVQPAAKKGLGTGAIIAIVVGSLIALCCIGGTIIAVFAPDPADKPSAVAATGGDAENTPAAKPTEAAAAAPSPTKAAEPDGPVTVKVGQPIDVKFMSAQTRVTVKSVKKAKSPNQFTQPKRGQFVAVMVDIFATKGQTDLGPSNFRLIAKDGTVYQSEFLVVGIDPQLDAMTTINEGQRKNGNVVFDADPANFAGAKVELTDDFGEVQGYWTT
ncbi:DUF4352 domain-containing protein [Catellatospora coxensis]|nr:DUF4352 domain-containing protein [Catellatospora coxensis]